jgi:hypothetical protein
MQRVCSSTAESFSTVDFRDPRQETQMLAAIVRMDTGAAGPSSTARPSEEDNNRQFVSALYPGLFPSTNRERRHGFSIKWQPHGGKASLGVELSTAGVGGCGDSPPRLALLTDAKGGGSGVPSRYPVPWSVWSRHTMAWYRLSKKPLGGSG